MYEIWELIGGTSSRLCSVDTLDAALDWLDGECRTRFLDLTANAEGLTQIRYRFEIRDRHGVVVGALTTQPDVRREYLSVILHGLRPGID